jgi:hypothetical protein
MIDKPENGHKPDLRDGETDPARDFQPATAVAEPVAHTNRTSPSSPEMASQTPTPPTEAARDRSAAVTEPKPAGETDFSSELTKFRQTFEEIQAEFISEPRAAVVKAEALIDRLMSTLHDQLQSIHSNVTTENDTEQLRVAMLNYREMFASLEGHRS